MGKDMVAVLNRQLKSYRPKKQPVKAHLGFASEHEEQIFRALVAVYPKLVRIDDAGWQLHADEHVKLGLFSCTRNGGAHTGRCAAGGGRAADARTGKLTFTD